MKEWVEAEFAAWRGFSRDRDQIEAELGELSLQDASVFLFRVADGDVAMLPRAETDATRHVSSLGLDIRAHQYLRMFRDAVRFFGVGGSATFAVSMHDAFPGKTDLPLFCYQQKLGSRYILLPDIDFPQHLFYSDERAKYFDGRPFAAKQRSAIFVGSTTGDYLTAEHVRELRTPRLRAAVRFRDHPRITFHLPQIVQCDSPETVAMVEALDVKGSPLDWHGQYEHRFLISVDGNGATCSRVYLSLNSNSVLLKYASPYQLHYFRGLVPWRHYVPVARDEDILDLIDNQDRHEALFADIAVQSKAFARRHLSRLSLLCYTARLLAEYVCMFGDGTRTQVAELDLAYDSYTHLGGTGTAWTTPGDWAGGGWIEGFAIVPQHGTSGDLRYHGLYADGSATAPCVTEQFCGTCGQSRPLFGIHIDRGGRAAKNTASHDIVYKARFADGFESEEVPLGQTIARDAPLTGFLLRTTPAAPRRGIAGMLDGALPWRRKRAI
ncbi:glycosyl transferase family 90 [Sphingomonas profundi]|uniref:glycosyl transferase family 90 n=1 Tax=Alterirhizorhabdus profundi TaxID=2681549 RepID=UPI0018D11CBC|nr:glycosyl transferase family 90 [Sphingomonas profundi]